MVERQELRAAIYGRVSSEQQAQQKTIDSQVAALEERVAQDGLVLDGELCFIDDGCSGSTLVRPALERLRDCAYAGGIDRLYVHSPDRLARKYAYQVLLLDELTHYGVEVVFLNHALGISPEEDLLLQVQGMISEYERAKIMERSRRGKRHAARRGSVNVLSGAPYGYRYVSKQEGNGEAHYRIVFEEARIAREMFKWYGIEGVSIGEICRRLKANGIRTRTGKVSWDRTTVWGMLKNPAYKGSAGFGKTRLGPRKPALRPQRGNEQSQRHYSIYPVPEEEQERIPVPAIVSEDLFAAAQDRLVDNKKHNRQRKRGARYLLQGLLQCQCCRYAYYGKPVSRSAAKGKTRKYAYYRCVGSDAYRFGGERICWNKQVRTDLLEAAVWEDVCALLQDPHRVRREYERRLKEEPKDQAAETAQLSTMIQKLKRGIARLIDAYEDGLLSKEEFEPRLRNAKSRLEKLETEMQAVVDQAAAEHELRLVIGQFEEFAQRVSEGLHEGDWTTRREIIRALVKRIEIGQETVRVVYKVAPIPFASAPDSGGSLQDCWRRAVAPAGEYRPELPGLAPRPRWLPLRAVCR
jgi:site-specific DNA recombinase